MDVFLAFLVAYLLEIGLKHFFEPIAKRQEELVWVPSCSGASGCSRLFGLSARILFWFLFGTACIFSRADSLNSREQPL
jgi:hypothetical protein